MRYLLLLRGINVGGNNIIPMADLRTLLGKLGHAEVSTYIASGNALFTAKDDGRGGVGVLADLAPAITKKFKCSPALVLRTKDELSAAIDVSPFADADPARVLIGFPTADAKPNAKAKLDLARMTWREPADAACVNAGHIHLHCPAGLGTTKLDPAYLDKLYGVTATYRNLRTCRTLLEKLGPS